MTTQFEFPTDDDLRSISADELAAKYDEAVKQFDTTYGNGSDLDEDTLDTLGHLTEGIETLSGEITRREEAKGKAAEMAARVHANSAQSDDEYDAQDGAQSDEETEEVSEGADESENAGEAQESAEDETSAEEDEDTTENAGDDAVTASGRNSRANGLPRQTPERTIKDVLRASGDGSDFAPGVGIDWSNVGQIVERRLRDYNHSQYAAANKSGRHVRQQFGVATIERPVDEGLRIESNDPEHVESVLRQAADEKRLRGGSLIESASLTASGGWCAPSETIYDLLEVESRDGLLSLPEVGARRGGISRTLGPDFADIFASDIGWNYTEQEDIDGDYDGAGGGSKPCYRIDCPDFEDFRLQVAGVCVQSGLLQQRSYPEVLARTTRGVLVAHDHKMSARRINAIVEGSDAVTIPSPQAGALAPLLTSLELQVEHMRYVRRLSRTATMEVVMPYWVRGVIRSDLARRNGVDLPSVSDSQIDGWFRSRGINPQYVYDWQDLTGDAGSFTAWPEEVQFLIYPAGTWVAAGSEIINIDTLYDSVLLGTNDFTALFTEESWMVVKMSHDSRVVTVPLCADGSTGAQVAFDCDGTVTAPAGA